MRIKYILTLLVIALSMDVSAQMGKSGFVQDMKSQSKRTIRGNDVNGGKMTESNRFNRGVPTGYRSQVLRNDSAYYGGFIKRHGWYEGRGRKMTLKEASHLTCYYKFSKKNATGHWTRMQAFNGYGNYVTRHGVRPLVMSQFDDKDLGANKEWKEKMQTVCQWQMIGSVDGKEVIQELALDRNDDVVYAFIPTKTGPNTYLGTYIDAWGRPAFARTDSLGNDFGYANFVEITRDDRGMEILYKFTDRNGIPVKNKDGAYMSFQEFDEDLNEVKSGLLDILGRKMIDDYGNCGMAYTYDKNTGDMLTSMSFDDQGKYCDQWTERTSTENGICGNWYRYDKYGREIEQGFLNTDGDSICNRYGAFRIVQKYNCHGQRTHLVAYDQAGKKVAKDSLGIAEYVNVIDSLTGHYLSAKSLDANGNYVNDEDGTCWQVWKFDGDDIVEETDYNVIDGSVKVNFYYKRDSIGNEKRIWYTDSLIRVDSVDSRGNETLRAWYNLEYRPVNNWGYHRRETDYLYGNKKRTSLRTWYDKDGNYAIEKYDDRSSNDYTALRIISDSVDHSEIYVEYLNGSLLDTYGFEQDETMETVNAQYELTYSGERARSGMEGALYYKGIIERDYNGTVKSFKGVNEFGEHSYVTQSSENAYQFYYRSGGKFYNYDENGKLVQRDSMRAFTSRLPMVFCIEVTDTAKARPLDIRNNDVIVGYGDWYVSEDLRTGMNNLYLEMILKNSVEKMMTVLRHHPTEHRSEIVKILLPTGSMSQFGFYAHQIFYTKKEKERLQLVAREAGVPIGTPYKDGSHEVILTIPTKGEVTDNPLYWDFKHRDVYVIVAADQQSPLIGIKDYWAIDRNTPDDFDSKKMIRAAIKASKHVILTADLTTPVELRWDGGIGATMEHVNLTDADYAKLMAFCRQHVHLQPADTVRFDWRKQSGKLTMNLLADSLEIVKEGQWLKGRGHEATDDLKETLEPFTEVVCFTFDSDPTLSANKHAIELIGKLNKRGYIAVESDKINSALYIAKQEKKKKGDEPSFTAALCVIGPRIYIFQGRFTEEQLHNVWSD